MADYDVLLEPFKLKHLTLRNRVLSTAHAPAYAENGMPGERYQAYHEEKARGGIGLAMFGGSSTVSVDCPATFGQLNVAQDSIVPYFRAFAERVHRHGTAIMCQITHMGRRTRWDTGDWLAPVAPSRVREPEHRSFPKAMEEWDIRRIVRDFGQAARRCHEGELDGVELSYAGAHLVPQFWSSGVNRRADGYGGSLANRMAFGVEILEEIRRQVGPDYIVGVRLSGDELVEDGLTPEECLAIARSLASTGMVDYLSVVGGNPRDWHSLAVHMPNMSFPVAPFLYMASAIRAEVDLPVFHAGRITDLATAARAVGDGHVDLVAMTRAHLADPHIVKKLMEGRADDIRQCVGAAYCIDRIYVGGEALCIQNAATGREQTMPHVVPKAASRRRVVVAGAGPAGLEAARVAAERGHAVILFEAEPRTGGQINLAARATWREPLSGITRWLDAQIRKLGVDLRLGTEATPEAVMAEQPDLVVVATGGRPDKGRMTGAELAVTIADVLTGRVEVAETVLLYDDEGEHRGLSCAEFMLQRGAKVELVTPERHVGIELGGTNFPIHLRELYKGGIVLTPDTRLVHIYREGNQLVAVLRNQYGAGEEERVVEQVVADHGTLPRDELYFALKPHSSNLGEVDLQALVGSRPQTIVNNPAGRFQLFRVGDAVASRNIHAAIYDSLRLCKEF